MRLNNLYRRMPSDDLDLMITAINIQYEVGGNLAQSSELDELTQYANESASRVKCKRDSPGPRVRIHHYVLPILIGIAVTLINPEYMSSLWDVPWIIMPICGGSSYSQVS